MPGPNIETKNLTLVLQTRQEVMTRLDGLSARERSEISPAWLELVEKSGAADPWIHGFLMVHRDSGMTVGQCGFKGPPTGDGVVEIAYGVAPEHEGKGYGTEAAEALASFALSDGRVRTVRAHTLPKANASTRILSKCGFECVGEVMDPEDGLVWRWEKRAGRSEAG